MTATFDIDNTNWYSPEDYGAKGDGTTNDDYAFAQMFGPVAPVSVSLPVGTPSGYTYKYVVTAINGSGPESIASPLAIITNSVASLGTGGSYNHISWTAVPGTNIVYNVYRVYSSGTPSSIGLLTPVPISNTYFDDTGISANTLIQSPPSSGAKVLLGAGKHYHIETPIAIWDKYLSIQFNGASLDWYGSMPTGIPISGSVSSVAVTSGGSYASAPTVNFSGGAVTGILITSGGSGYTSAPTVNFSGGGGSGATATATISNGVVIGITITNAGSGYTSAPTIGFSSGSASATAIIATGATATANLTGSAVSSISVSPGGSGYTTVPTVSFSGGGGSGAAAIATLSGASYATPIVLTLPSGHGIVAGQQVFVTGVEGCTAANGWWTVSNYDTTTITLNGSVGNGPYIQGGTVYVMTPVLSVGWRAVGTTDPMYGGAVNKDNHHWEIINPTIRYKTGGSLTTAPNANYLFNSFIGLQWLNVFGGNTTELSIQGFGIGMQCMGDSSASKQCDHSIRHCIDNGIQFHFIAKNTQSIADTSDGRPSVFCEEQRFSGGLVDYGAAQFSSGDITNVTIDSPGTAGSKIIITSAGHNLKNGNVVTIAGVQGIPESNLVNSPVTILSSSTFSLDNSSYSGSGTYTTGGTFTFCPPFTYWHVKAETADLSGSSVVINGVRFYGTSLASGVGSQTQTVFLDNNTKNNSFITVRFEATDHKPMDFYISPSSYGNVVFVNITGDMTWKDQGTNSFYFDNTQKIMPWYSKGLEFNNAQFRGGLSTAGYGAPSGVLVTPSPTGSTHYSYVVTQVASDGTESSASSAPYPIDNGPATLNNANYNVISWAPVPGAKSYNIYRVSSAGSPFQIQQIASTNPPMSSNNTLAFADQGGQYSIVNSVTVSIGGSGYSSTVPPTVTFSTSDWGTTATGYAKVSGGAVTDVIITNPGSGYKNAPSVVFSGTGGATATTTIASPVPFNLSCTPNGSGSTTTYYYKITANNMQGETGFSSAKSVSAYTPMSSSNYVTLLWSPLSGATSYNVYRSPDGITYKRIVTGVTDVTFDDKNFKDIDAPGTITITQNGTPGITKVSYVITANTSTPVSNTACESLGSAVASTTTSNFDLSTSNSNHLSWSSVSNAVSYNVYRVYSDCNASAPESQTGLIASGVTTLTFDDIGYKATGSPPSLRMVCNNVGASGSTLYKYQITGSTPSGESTVLATVQTTTGNSKLDNTNYNQLIWDPVPGVVSYNIYRMISDGETFQPGRIASSVQSSTYLDMGGSLYGAPQTLSVTPQGSTGSTTYKYYVTGVSLAGESIASSTITITNGYGVYTLLDGTNYNLLTWLPLSGASSYNVYRWDGSTFNRIASNIGINQFSDKGSIPIAPPTGVSVTGHGGSTTGSTYYSYVVTAVAPDGTESLPSSASIADGTVATITTGSQYLSSADYNAVNWSSVTGASSYNVYRVRNDGPLYNQAGTLPANTLGKLTNTTSTSFNDASNQISSTIGGKAVAIPQQNDHSSSLGVAGSLIFTGNNYPPANPGEFTLAKVTNSFSGLPAGMVETVNTCLATSIGTKTISNTTTATTVLPVSTSLVGKISSLAAGWWTNGKTFRARLHGSISTNSSPTATIAFYQGPLNGSLVTTGITLTTGALPNVTAQHCELEVVLTCTATGVAGTASVVGTIVLTIDNNSTGTPTRYALVPTTDSTVFQTTALWLQDIRWAWGSLTQSVTWYNETFEVIN